MNEKELESLLVHALREAKATPPAERITSARLGSLPVGAVARYDLKSPSNTALVYLIPGDARFLVVMLSVPAGEDGRMEGKFERSLASLRFKTMKTGRSQGWGGDRCSRNRHAGMAPFNLPRVKEPSTATVRPGQPP